MKNLRIAVAYYRTLSSQSSASLTAGYLTAHLRHSGLHVDIIQLEISDSVNDVCGLINANPDLIFYKPNFQDIHRLPANMSALTFHLPKIGIGLFGPFAVLNSEILLRNYTSIRGIILPNHEFVTAINISWWIGDSIEPTSDGVIAKGKQGILVTPYSPSLVKENIYSLLPARDIEKMEPIVIVNLEASRGCINACTFCHIPVLSRTSGVPIIRRSVDDVILEMRTLYSEGKRYYIFNDAILGGGCSSDSITWLWELADRLCAEPLEYYFMGYFTTVLLDQHPDLFEKLADAGLIRVFIGLEASTDSAMRRFKKPFATSRYERLKAWLQKRYIVPHIGFMLFHPFATPVDLLSGIKFLYTHGEIHRFATIREKARLVPGTQLMQQAVQAGLTFSDENFDNINRYRFANIETQFIHDRMNATWEEIGVPVFERLEHLFVTGFFILNMIRRLHRSNQRILHIANTFNDAHLRYSKEFFLMTQRLLLSPGIQLQNQMTFTVLLQEVQQIWYFLIDASKQTGIEVPLSWITTGDLRSEVARPANYDGRCSTTRSGRL